MRFVLTRPADRHPLRHQYAGDGRAGAAARIKERWPAYPAMMVTAYGDNERRRLAGEYCAIEFITKPVDFGHLKVQLRQLAGAAD
jgi:DNA-binding NtrC family response regulator